MSNSLSLSLTHTHTPETFQVYKIYIIHFVLCMYCSLSLFVVKVFKKSSSPNSNIIHLQIKLSSTNLLLLCFSLNIRTKYWVLSCVQLCKPNVSHFWYLSFCWIWWCKLIISLISQQYGISCTQTDKRMCAFVSIKYVTNDCNSWTASLQDGQEAVTFLELADLLGREISLPAILDPEFASVEGKRWMEMMYFILNLKTNIKSQYSVFFVVVLFTAAQAGLSERM